MKDIDKTKQNIKLNEMEENERNNLFKKFTEAGGEVVDAKKQKRNIAIDREKQREHQKKLDAHYRDKKPSPKRVNTGTDYKNSSKQVSNAQNSSIFDRFRIKFRLLFLGITGFSAVFFKNSFFKKFVNNYSPSLMTIQMIFLSLFKNNPQAGNRIIQGLDKISPRYYELIEMTGELFNQSLISQIVENFNNYPNTQQPVSGLKEPLMELYRSLYMLKPHENAIYNAFDRAVGINSTFAERKNDWNFKNKDLRNSLIFIFEKLYPRLHTLFCHYQGALYSETDPEIENILSIATHEKPGTRIRQDSSSIRQAEKKSNEKTGSEETEDSPAPASAPKIDNATKEGLILQYNLDNKVLRLQYDKKNELELLSDTDKALITYLLFQEFENEYSFILTTNKIRFNIDYSTGVKIDYRTKMQDLFNRLNKCQDAFKEYYDIIREHDKINKERPTNNSQYIAYSKKLDGLIEKKTISGITYRSIIKAFMDDLTAELKVLINDMDSEQKFVANPQDMLEFNPALEGEKKLNKRKIYEAIKTLYNFASALSYRISSDGDLTGRSEFNESKKLINTEDESSSQNSENNTSGKDDNNDNDKEDKSKKTILDELDDLV